MVGWYHQPNGHKFEQTLGDIIEGQGSLACCSSWGHKQSDTTEQLNNKGDGQGPRDAHCREDSLWLRAWASEHCLDPLPGPGCLMPWERATYEGDQGGQQQDSNQEVLELFQHKLPQGLACEQEHRMRAGILTNRVHAELRWPTPSVPFEWGEPEALRGKRGNAADSARPHSPGRGGHRLTVTGLLIIYFTFF